jgi:hypothetical protein
MHEDTLPRGKLVGAWSCYTYRRIVSAEVYRAARCVAYYRGSLHIESVIFVSYLKMEATGSSDTVTTHKTTLRHNPEDYIPLIYTVRKQYTRM